MITAREAALLALNDIYFEGKYSNLAVKDMLKKCRNMGKEDKALFTNIVYGTVSRRYTIEYIIKKHSSVKLKKIARYARVILDLGIYQILYMDKIPDSAAVNESVKLAKKYCKKGTDRFINAVLRAVSNEGKNFELPRDITENLSVKNSFSHEMTNAFIESFGVEFADELMQALNEPAEFLLRPNSMVIDAQGMVTELEKSGISAVASDDGMVKAEGFDVAENPLYKKGYFTPQDRGAYNAALVLNPQENETVIDMCAAPGGKTTHIAELMNNTGKVIACDKYEHKIKLINNAVKRLGITSVQAQVCDSALFNPEFESVADRILCDVPCSGWGIIRRKPDIKFSHTDIDGLYEIQRSILKNASKYLKSNGCIVYSTCTLNRLENEDMIAEFLKENNDFEKVYEKTFYPNKDNSDGFFICRMDRK